MTKEQELRMELKSIVNQYDPMTKMYTAIALILIAVVWIVVSIVIGEFWLSIIVIVGVLVFDRLGISIKSDSVPVKKLSYDACCIMEQLIHIKTSTHKDNSTRAGISTVGVGSHLPLYQTFVQHYPELASEKLRALAGVTLKYEDIG